MSKKTNTKTHFTVDFINGTILGTKSGFDKAGRGIEPYYQELMGLIKKHPNYSCVVKGIDTTSDKSKNTYKGMDIAFMQRYISAIMDNSDSLLRELKARRDNAKKLHLAVYPTLKKWFLGVVDPDGNGFDMQEAFEKILEAETKKSLHNSKTENQKAETVIQAVKDNRVILDEAS